MVALSMVGLAAYAQLYEYLSHNKVCVGHEQVRASQPYRIMQAVNWNAAM